MNQTPYIEPPYQLDEDDIEEGGTITIYAGGGAVPIATVLNYDDFPCADNDVDLPKCHAEALATARLFVASPDLYNALKSIVACYGVGESPEKFVEHVHGFINDAQAAIAKATQGTQ